MSDTRTITAIQIQEKRKDRFSIFLDDEFAFGVHQDVLLKAGIAKGDKLAPEQIEAIRQMEQRRGAKEKAFRLLAARPRSVKEMRDRLHQAGFAAPDIDAVVVDLTQLKLLNDAEFALMFARNRMVTKPCGEFLLRRELQQKGIGEADINAAVAEAFQETSEYEVARQLAAKNFRKQKRLDEDKAAKRVADFLMRRGFAWDIVKDVIEHWTDSEQV